MELMIPTFFGLAIAFLAFGSVVLTRRRPAEQRLARLSAPTDRSTERQRKSEAVQSRIERIRDRIATFLPAGQETNENNELSLRRRLVHAGYRKPSAPTSFRVLRLVLGVGLPAVVMLFPFVWGMSQLQIVLLICIAAVAGALLPSFVLGRLVKHRQRAIELALPDALDLMVVCVEAGLGLNASLARVGSEHAKGRSALSEEFQLTTVEIRAGKSTSEALRSLAARTGVLELKLFASLMIQTDRFGTNVAEALRVHCDAMRAQRLLRAEEAATKAPIKMLFPMGIFIFPAMLEVTLGACMLTLLPAFGG